MAKEWKHLHLMTMFDIASDLIVTVTLWNINPWVGAEKNIQRKCNRGGEGGRSELVEDSTAINIGLSSGIET